ncbi:hypothetical protein [Streptomyces phaeochromogenes]
MRIGQVAVQGGVSVRALRYYEVDSGEAESAPWPVTAARTEWVPSSPPWTRRPEEAEAL